MNRISLLVVEDSPADAALVREYLRGVPGFAYELEMVDTLAQALVHLNKRDVDVVLLDLSLPDSTGIDTVRTLTNRHPQLVIIVLTGLRDEQVALQSVRYGAQDYLEKGQLSPNMLHRSIVYSLERKKSLREKENLLADLALALEKIEMLQEMLPVCPCCKKIQAEDKKWWLVDEYVKSPGRQMVGKSVCPECLAHLG